MTGVSECSQQRGNLKDNGYINDSYNTRSRRRSEKWRLINDKKDLAVPLLLIYT
ncbi:hypothetical protein ABLB90_02515 [Photorhabdus bodei]|uniref:hypothetical protein n=1 Tax=Photorhabdus bodei TaxID=2029681 RepID=UPI0032B8380C